VRGTEEGRGRRAMTQERGGAEERGKELPAAPEKGKKEK
jgi:hypothetical protein